MDQEYRKHSLHNTDYERRQHHLIPNTSAIMEEEVAETILEKQLYICLRRYATFYLEKEKQDNYTIGSTQK